jgi:hypothetical protein
LEENYDDDDDDDDDDDVPGIGRTTISHSVSIVVRMYPGSAQGMRLQ